MHANAIWDLEICEVDHKKLNPTLSISITVTSNLRRKNNWVHQTYLQI